jgi:hypothetical protein
MGDDDFRLALTDRNASPGAARSVSSNEKGENTMNKNTNGFESRIIAVAIASLAMLVGPVSWADPEGSGIVTSVRGAPVVPDGTVAGAQTDFVITLDTSLDPAVPGRELPALHTIKVTLPEGFVNTGAVPLRDLFTPDCVPLNLQCSTAVLLQGWPQHPILPSFPPGGAPQYSLSLEGSNTLVYTADIPIVAGLPVPGPGIKQMHLLFFGFRNPTVPGFYTIQVEAQTGPGGAVETGAGVVRITPETRPHIGVTSVFNAGAPNTIYQTTAPNEFTPLPYDFLIWDRDGGPLEGVTAEMVNNNFALLRQGERTVGTVSIESPPGAVGQEVMTTNPSVEINAPVTGVPTARLTVHFRAGSEAGDYEATFSLLGGDSVTMFVTAN